jgi:hypothetical protein
MPSITWAAVDSASNGVMMRSVMAGSFSLS